MERKPEIQQKHIKLFACLWLDYVTHTIVYGETGSKNNHIGCCLKGMKIENLSIVTDRLKSTFFQNTSQSLSKKQTGE